MNLTVETFGQVVAIEYRRHNSARVYRHEFKHSTLAYVADQGRKLVLSPLRVISGEIRDARKDAQR